MLLPLAIALATLVLLTLRLLYVLPSTHATPPPRPAKGPKHLMILLGSGGHTAEMLLLLSNSLPSPHLHKRTYIYTSGDTLSLQKAVAFEHSLSPSSSGVAAISIPRARRVGQSWFTTPWTSLLCLVGSIRAFSASGAPDVVLTNGPGSAVLMVLVALCGRFLGVCGTRTVYVESFARVRTLSLSGRLLYPCVDRFLVQWAGLTVGRPRAEYRSVLVL